MNNIVSNFDQIVEFAKNYSLPLTKKRAILREYLQVKVLEVIYKGSDASKIIFVGGTSLRLTKNIDRFSEDLDFDLKENSKIDTDKLIKKTYKQLLLENIDIDLYENKTKRRNYYEFRFNNLLNELGIGKNVDEKLTIKFDFENNWIGHIKETVLLNRYGYLFNLVTIGMGQHLVQKLTAYVRRKQTQPRDIYDIIWLISNGAKPDWEFGKKNGISKEIVRETLKKFEKEKKKSKIFQTRLKPFLINDKSIDKIMFFPEVLKSINTGR